MSFIKINNTIINTDHIVLVGKIEYSDRKDQNAFEIDVTTTQGILSFSGDVAEGVWNWFSEASVDINQRTLSQQTQQQLSAEVPF